MMPTGTPRAPLESGAVTAMPEWITVTTYRNRSGRPTPPAALRT